MLRTADEVKGVFVGLALFTRSAKSMPSTTSHVCQYVKISEQNQVCIQRFDLPVLL